MPFRLNILLDCSKQRRTNLFGKDLVNTSHVQDKDRSGIGCWLWGVWNTIEVDFG